MNDTTSIKRGALKLAIVTAVAAGLWLSAAGTAADPDSADTSNVALASVAASPVPEAGVVKFVPNITPISCSGTLELQKTAEIPGKEIRVRQVVRWSEADSASFGAIADLVIDRYDTDGNRKLTLDELKSTLTGAGVNLGLVRFRGPTVCLLSHADVLQPDVPTDDHKIVQQWLDAKKSPMETHVELPAVDTSIFASQPTSVTVTSSADDAQANPVHSLRDLLIQDVSQRLNVPVDQLQVAFNSKDRTLLNLAEPTFRFGIAPLRVRDLGRVSWDVVITTGEKQKTVEVIADAREWQKQLVVEKATNYKQVIRDEDVTERRVLVDHLPEDSILTREQIIGQQAARDLKPGTVLTGRLIDPVSLAKQGQYVTVTLNQGGVQVRTVAKALESGSYGQTIKVKSEQSQDVFDVTLIGPQNATMGPAPE